MYEKYAAMRDAGATPSEVYRTADNDGVRHSDMFKLLRDVFSLSLVEAKEVIIVSSGTASSLDEHLDRLATEIEKALDDLPESNDDAAS